MNLVFHQLKKDILRTRVVLVLWFVLVVLQFAFIGWSAKPGDALMQSLSPMLSGLLTIFNYLLVLVLVPLLIHQEPLVGTTAFWFTRPLARTTVLASKSLYVLMLLALPILAQSGVFLANGVTFHDIALAAPELLVSQLSWIVIVASLAVLTPNFARFAIVGAIVLVIWYLSLFVLQMIMLMRNPQSFVSTLASLTSSRALVGSFITLGFGCAVVLLQYLTRRFVLAITLAIASLFLGLAAQYLWPWDFLKPPVHILADSEFHADLVDVKLASPFGTLDQPSIRGGTPLKQVYANFNFKDCPQGYVIKIGAINTTLKPSDGKTIPLQSINNQMVYQGNIDPDAVEKALDGVPVLNMAALYNNNQPLLELNAETYSRYASKPLDYSSKLDCTAYKYVVATELPLAKGARFDRGSEHLVVTDVLEQSNGIDLLLRQKNVRLLFAPRGPDQSVYDRDHSGAVYLLLNKVRHQAIMQKLNATFNFSMMNKNILTNEPLRISFGPDDNTSRYWLAPQLDKAWLADAVLVRLDLTPVATFTRTLAIPGFRLDGNFVIPDGRRQHRVADLETLDQITLPHDATREQVRNYITEILTASRRLESNDEHDPQVGMLEKVGAENVDLLIQMARDNHNYYLNHAINTLAQPDHKEMVIEAFATNHDLINTIVDHGWQSDAKSTLLEVFADRKENSSKWVVAVAMLNDPSTYDSLKNYYIDCPTEDVFKALQSLPNFDLAGTVDLAWKKARRGQSWQIRDMLQPAAQFGESDVIDVIINILKKKERDNYLNQRARMVLKQYTPATGATDSDLIAWYDSNKANLVFDHQTGKFIIQSSAISPTQVKTDH